MAPRWYDKLQEHKMDKVIDEFGVRFITDPTGHYEQLDGDGEVAFRRCVQGVGMLAQFMLGTKETLSDNMEGNYQFGWGWQMAKGDQARVTADGVFNYPGDPPLYPYLKAQELDGEGGVTGEVVYIYPYALVIVMRDGKLVKRQRMD
jgi:hypothetical protein